MADSALATAAGPVEVLAYVDDDDPHRDAYSKIGNARVLIGSRIVLSDCWNQLAAQARGDILGMAADDIRYRTPGWDTKIREAFAQYADRIVFVYGRDGIHDEKLGTHGFVSRRWIETVGYFTWPGFPADYADTWLHDVAKRIGRAVYLPDILIEHLHPIAGKADWDQTHQERLARADHTIYRRLASRRAADARVLEAACFS